MRYLTKIAHNNSALIICVLAIITILTRFYYRSKGYDMYDIAMFAYGVDTLKPIHPPGYPIFILSAYILNFITHNSLVSLIYISIVSSAFFIVASYLIARILFEDKLIATLSVLLLLSSPTVWVFGIMGMSDMLQAALVSIVVLFSAATLRYKTSKYYYIALIFFGITLGAKLTHILLVPLLLYSGFIFRNDLKLIIKLIFCLTLSIALWAIPFYGFMATPTLIAGTRELMVRDVSAYNILNVGPITKLIQLVSYSAYTHFLILNHISYAFLVLIFVVLCIFINLSIKNKKMLLFYPKYRLANARRFVTTDNKFVFILLWVLPYFIFNFIFIAARLRYYLPIYPAVAISCVVLLNMIICNFSLKERSPNFRKSSLTIIVLIFVLFSFIVSVTAVSPYHNELDTRSQVVSFITDLAKNDSCHGKDTAVYINSLWPGRMEFQAYLMIYKTNMINNLSLIVYSPLQYPASKEEVNNAEQGLLTMLNEKSKSNRTDVYFVGDLVSPSDALANENNTSKLRLKGDFFREDEWVIDDPQGHIRIYQYKPLELP